MANVIVQDALDFLKRYPPFDKVEIDNLYPVGDQLQIRFVKKGDAIFSEGDAHSGHIYIVKSGAIQIDNTYGLVDKCDEGDIFGIRSGLSGNSYQVTAHALENSLLFTWDSQRFRSFLNDYPEVNNFFLKGLASGMPVLTAIKDTTTGESGLGLKKLNDVSIIKPQKELIHCFAHDTIRTSAKRMSDAGIGSILVVDDKIRPLGIVTDSDFRKKVVAKALDINEPISTIMSSPVQCIHPQPSFAEVQLLFIKENFHHLCVTSDGTDRTAAQGILSNHDLLLERGDHPGIILKEMRKAGTIDSVAAIRRRFQSTIADFIAQEVNITFISRITTYVNEAMVQRMIELVIEEDDLGISKRDMVWMNLGSEGRKEQLLQTDIDNALMFRVPEGSTAEAERTRYIKLAERVNNGIVSSGFARCPADMMASNPKYCLSVDEWKSTFAHWISEPTEESIMFGNIFFDYKRVYGSKRLIAELTRHIFDLLDRKPIFLNFMARNAQKNPPPLSFFKSFMVERNGEHKDQFDLKLRAMMPLVDVARLLILDLRISSTNNTTERYEVLSEQLESDQSLMKEAARAYDALVQLRALQGMKHHDSGRYIHLDEMAKLQRQTLRNIFRIVAELQSFVRQRYQLQYFGS